MHRQRTSEKRAATAAFKHRAQGRLRAVLEGLSRDADGDAAPPPMAAKSPQRKYHNCAARARSVKLLQALDFRRCCAAAKPAFDTCRRQDIAGREKWWTSGKTKRCRTATITHRLGVLLPDAVGRMASSSSFSSANRFFCCSLPCPGKLDKTDAVSRRCRNVFRDVSEAERQGEELRAPNSMLEVWVTTRNGEALIVQNYTNSASCIVAMGEHREGPVSSPA